MIGITRAVPSASRLMAWLTSSPHAKSEAMEYGLTSRRTMSAAVSWARSSSRHRWPASSFRSCHSRIMPERRRSASWVLSAARWASSSWA